MGFDWSKYESGGNYISAAEKKVMAEEGIPFEVVAIRETEKFEGRHYELSILAPDPETGETEERTLSFTIGSGAASRDEQLAGLKAYLDDGGEPELAVLTKIGRAYFVKPAR